MKKLAVVILAAGEGTRMKSSVPKVLHGLGGRPLIRWVLDTVKSLEPEAIYVVVGHGANQVKKELSNEDLKFVEQEKQLGSGHALQQAEKYLKKYKGDILVISADVPLVNPATLKALIQIHEKENNSATVLSALVEDAYGYGRISRSKNGRVAAIIEEKDASESVRKIKEINSGIYCFQSPLIWEALNEVKTDNVKKEYYLTDAISILNNMDKKVGSWPRAKEDELLGINTRVQLSCAGSILRQRINKELMHSGVTIIDPSNTYIDFKVDIGRDTTIHPGSVISGETVIGRNCTIGPYSVIEDSRIQDDVCIVYSHVRGSNVKSNSNIGPFSNIRLGKQIKNKGRR
ncbi:MAG: bifunctional UDP-N-acetylglucosamine diphosphorylase/glucosamine-1-phosphate N-acetyltransferase GlmU [Elusimicrobia bacterium]|nr:bifunctional UDP-N-acetylglucosamine diphosphorylase/glucosamine-1-phosphate N-acetyltransferase GlmU [Candidatus Liberimonas magnetica]